MPLLLSVTEESEPLVVESATVPPEPVRLLPSASLSWTVTVEVELPSAVIEPGAALIVEVAVEAAPALTVIEALVPVIVPVTVSVAVTVREPAVLRVTESAWVPLSPPAKV